MDNYIVVMGLIAFGMACALICIVAGSWIMFKAKTDPASGQGFLREAKGDVFSIPDEGVPFPGAEEPSEDEKNVLDRTKTFLKALGGSE